MPISEPIFMVKDDFLGLSMPEARSYCSSRPVLLKSYGMGFLRGKGPLLSKEVENGHLQRSNTPASNICPSLGYTTPLLKKQFHIIDPVCLSGVNLEPSVVNTLIILSSKSTSRHWT